MHLQLPATVSPLPPQSEVVRAGGPLAAGVGLSAEEWGMLSKFALGALTSQGTMGGLLLSGLVGVPGGSPSPILNFFKNDSLNA